MIDACQDCGCEIRRGDVICAECAEIYACSQIDGLLSEVDMSALIGQRGTKVG